MLELGLTPFSAEVKQFTNLHWMVFYFLIKKREQNLINIISDILGIKIDNNQIIPLSMVINPELGGEILKRKEAVELKKTFEEELKDYSVEELKYLTSEIDKILKKERNE